ncbi:FtsB family cell division protein [Secundilactobacillus paracollinoides]|nr:septum formation initiator family protein [Secundilactobacillus paracollinoides]
MGQTTQQISARKTKLSTIKQTSQRLQGHVDRLNDKSYLEKLIRSKYYYSKSGETIYSLPYEKSSDVTAK